MNTIIKAAILTVSDSRTREDDVSGDRLQALLEESGFEISVRLLINDDLILVRDAILALAEREDVDLVLTSGGTGFGPRDNTPEATQSIIEREAPGLAEAMRRETSAKTPMAMLSRGVCGIRSGTLIVNLPGSPKGVEECFLVIKPVLEHAVLLLRGNTAH